MHDALSFAFCMVAICASSSEKDKHLHRAHVVLPPSLPSPACASSSDCDRRLHRAHGIPPLFFPPPSLPSPVSSLCEATWGHCKGCMQDYKPNARDWLSSYWKGFMSPDQMARIRNTGVPMDFLKEVAPTSCLPLVYCCNYFHTSHCVYICLCTVPHVCLLCIAATCLTPAACKVCLRLHRL